jgi:hypothetical protein
VSSGRGLCDGLITRPGESYRLWRVDVCDQETSHARRLKPATGLWNTNPQWVVAPVKKMEWKNTQFHSSARPYTHNHYMIALGYVITLYDTCLHPANSRLSDTVAS